MSQARLLLLIKNRQSERQLADYLPAFDLVSLSPENIRFADITQESFDLIILDVETLSGYYQELLAWRESVMPLSLPMLALVPGGAIGQLDASLRSLLSAFVVEPIEPAELDINLAVLLQLRRLSCELAQQTQQLDEAAKLKSQFVSAIAHEFRNPLSVISALTQLLQRSGSELSVEKHSTMLKRIRSAAKRLTNLMDSLLAFNRNASEQVQFNPQNIDIESHCKAVLADFELINKGMYEINFQTEGDCSNVFVDATLVSTILNNLLSNALKYSPDDSPASLRLKRTDKQLIIEVDDAGQGIPEADQLALFDAFFRARNAGKVEGTGLGLSIVKQCVELHQGTIEVKSEVGRGTSFIVSLSLQPGDQSNTRSPSTHQAKQAIHQIENMQNAETDKDDAEKEGITTES